MMKNVKTSKVILPYYEFMGLHTRAEMAERKLEAAIRVLESANKIACGSDEHDFDNELVAIKNMK